MVEQSHIEAGQLGPVGRLRLAAAGFEAELAPSLGGRLTMLRHAGRDIVVPLPHDHADPLAWGKGGGYPLVPFHNRIENAQLSFDGAVISLQPHPSGPHSLHGPGQCRPWRLSEQDAGSATLALDYAADADWPWPFTATQHFALDAGGVTVAMTLRNSSDRPMPAGLGWHPYFTAGEVTEDARFHWPFLPDYVPTGRRLEGAGPLSETTRYLESWSMATIATGAMNIVLTASPELAHLVVHRAGDYVCLEAVTHVANGFNLAARGHAHTGMRVLAPGEVMTGSLHIAVR